MIKTIWADLDKKTFSQFYLLLSNSFKNKPLDFSSHKFFHELQERVTSLLPKDYIIIVADSFLYNIQTKKNSVWIFLVERAKVLVYKPKPFAFPQISKYDPISPEDIRIYAGEISQSFVKDISLVSNNLISAERTDSILLHIKAFLNKNKEKDDPIVELVKNLKVFFLTKADSIFIHIVIASKKSLSYSLNAEENDSEEKSLKINFSLSDRPGTYTLIVFEKQGANDDFASRVLSKWKEILLIIVMMCVLVLLSACISGRRKYVGIDISAVCQNQSAFVMTIAMTAVVYVFVKNIRKSKEKWDAIKKLKGKTAD